MGNAYSTLTLSPRLRVPSVCQYAHKLAYMVGESLNRAPHPNMENFLFYL